MSELDDKGRLAGWLAGACVQLGGGAVQTAVQTAENRPGLACRRCGVAEVWSVCRAVTAAEGDKGCLCFAGWLCCVAKAAPYTCMTPCELHTALACGLPSA